jgi:hypothetical protein
VTVAAAASGSLATFPSVAWFEALAERMRGNPEKYRKLGPVELTLVLSIVYPDGRRERYAVEFEGLGVRSVAEVSDVSCVDGRHPVILEGEYAAFRDMIESIQTHGHADLTHTLNYLTLPDWPFTLQPVDEGAGQLDVDRFYRYNQSLQEFFDEAATVPTRFVT